MVRIAFRVVADPNVKADVPTVLAFNGAFFNMGLWRHAANAWAAAGLRCVLHDVRGSGASAAAPEATDKGQFTFDTFCEDAAALLQHLGLSKAIVVGMAWGARPAVVFAVKKAIMTQACVLFDVSLGNSSTAEHLAAQKFSLRLAREKAERLGLQEPSARKDIAQHADQKMTARAMGATRKAPYDNGEAFLSIVMAGVSCPLLAVMGEFDPNMIAEGGGAKAVVSALKASSKCPIAQLQVLDAAGHASIKTNPFAGARSVLTFLQELSLLQPPSAL